MAIPLEQQTPLQLRRTIFWTAVWGAVIGTTVVEICYPIFMKWI